MGQTLITESGVFSDSIRQAINSNFSGLYASGGAATWWVRPQSGNDNNDGTSYDTAFASMSPLSSALQPGQTIALEGVLKQEWSAPIVNDVTLVGFGNQPRQATTDGTANGGGATWLSPSGGTGTLLTLNGQAWKVQNIFFNNSATGATTSCVKVATVGDPPATADGSHAQILGCIMTGGNFGIYAPDGPNYVTIQGCTFYNFASSGDTAIKAAQSVRTLLGWKIQDCVFYNNVNHVVAALSRGTVTGNNFIIVGNSVTSTIALSLTGGAGNAVANNLFNRPLNTSPNATLYVGGTNDVWGANVGSDDYFFGVPDNS